MRRAARTDGNQAQIILALSTAGMSVQSLAGLGGGVPDLLVGFGGVNVLLEVKDGEKPPSGRHETDCQVAWAERWRGQRAVVTTAEEAVRAVIAAAQEGKGEQ